MRSHHNRSLTVAALIRRPNPAVSATNPSFSPRRRRGAFLFEHRFDELLDRCGGLIGWALQKLARAPFSHLDDSIGKPALADESMERTKWSSANPGFLHPPGELRWGCPF